MGTDTAVFSSSLLLRRGAAHAAVFLRASSAGNVARTSDSDLGGDQAQTVTPAELSI